MQTALLEAVKEFFRIVVLAIIPVIIDGLGKQAIDWRLIGVIGAIAGLRFLDKALHEVGKEQDSNLMKRGLTQF